MTGGRTDPNLMGGIMLGMWFAGGLLLAFACVSFAGSGGLWTLARGVVIGAGLLVSVVSAVSAVIAVAVWAGAL